LYEVVYRLYEVKHRICSIKQTVDDLLDSDGTLVFLTEISTKLGSPFPGGGCGTVGGGGGSISGLG